VSRPEHPEKKGKDRGKNVLVAAISAADLLGSDGVVVKATDNAEVVVGEPPRAIGGPTGSLPTRTGGLAAAAVDVARVRLFDQPEADLRVGHMEVAAAVPAGGLDCPGIGMGKQADVDSVRAGERFTWTITASNANDCLLDKIKVLDTITATPGVRYRVVSSSPAGASVSDSGVTFDGLGPLPPGASTRLSITVEVDQNSALGRFTDEAVATGMCGSQTATAGADGGTGAVGGTKTAAAMPVDGRVSLDFPEVSAVRVASAGRLQVLGEVASLPGRLARTGGAVGLAGAAALVAAGVILRRCKPRRPST
jgi:hypothetical protein